jgi:peptide/nickel transport system permease protein
VRGRDVVRLGSVVTLSATTVLVVLASVVAPNPPDRHFDGCGYAPPARIHVRDADGWRMPFVYTRVIEDRATQRYGEDTTRPHALRWLAGGRLVSVAAEAGPLLLLGGDPLGRDVFARLLHGARRSLGVAGLGLIGALGLGALVGGIAGVTGGRADHWLMAAADLVLVLPGAYLVLALRGMMPLDLSISEVFFAMAVLLAFSAWPHVARGVRAIVATERTRDYAEAARAAGAGRFRLLMALLPAAGGFLAVEVVLLLPALLVAEVTVSFLGLGFPSPTASWGTMLQDAQSTRALADAPWLLAPAAAIFLLVLVLHLIAGPATTTATFTAGSHMGLRTLTRVDRADSLVK